MNKFAGPNYFSPFDFLFASSRRLRSSMLHPKRAAKGRSHPISNQDELKSRELLGENSAAQEAHGRPESWAAFWFSKKHPGYENFRERGMEFSECVCSCLFSSVRVGRDESIYRCPGRTWLAIFCSTVMKVDACQRQSFKQVMHQA